MKEPTMYHSIDEIQSTFPLFAVIGFWDVANISQTIFYKQYVCVCWELKYLQWIIEELQAIKWLRARWVWKFNVIDSARRSFLDIVIWSILAGVRLSLKRHWKYKYSLRQTNLMGFSLHGKILNIAWKDAELLFQFLSSLSPISFWSGEFSHDVPQQWPHMTVQEVISATKISNRVLFRYVVRAKRR